MKRDEQADAYARDMTLAVERARAKRETVLLTKKLAREAFLAGYSAGWDACASGLDETGEES